MAPMSDAPQPPADEPPSAGSPAAPGADAPAAETPPTDAPPTVDRLESPESEAAPPPLPTDPGLVERLRPIMKPLAARATLVSRIWLPTLAPAEFRARTVRYPARDYWDDDDGWVIELPAQCWATGATEGLEARDFELEVRRYEQPVLALGMGLGFAVFFLLLLVMLYWWPLLALAALSLLGGVGFLMAQSRREAVRLRIWSKPERLDDLTAPDVVSHEDELHVIVGARELAEAARRAVSAQRIKRSNYRPTVGAPTAPRLQAGVAVDAAGAAPPGAGPSAPPSTAPRRTDLPPISLDDPPEPSGGSMYRREELPPIKLDE